jgi:hypothetical protein
MKSPSTGRIWLDRNLGATQTQVTSSTNSACPIRSPIIRRFVIDNKSIICRGNTR